MRQGALVASCEVDSVNDLTSSCGGRARKMMMMLKSESHLELKKVNRLA